MSSIAFISSKTFDITICNIAAPFAWTAQPCHIITESRKHMAVTWLPIQYQQAGSTKKNAYVAQLQSTTHNKATDFKIKKTW